jgi:hypothetical protein
MSFMYDKKRKTTQVITPQVWNKEMETELSDSEVLTLPGGFEPTMTPKSLA